MDSGDGMVDSDGGNDSADHIDNGDDDDDDDDDGDGDDDGTHGGVGGTDRQRGDMRYDLRWVGGFFELARRISFLGNPNVDTSSGFSCFPAGFFFPVLIQISIFVALFFFIHQVFSISLNSIWQVQGLP